MITKINVIVNDLWNAFDDVKDRLEQKDVTKIKTLLNMLNEESRNDNN
jgi:hypothetical protein